MTLILLAVLAVVPVVNAQDDDDEGYDEDEYVGREQVEAAPPKEIPFDSVPMPPQGVFERETIPNKIQPIPYAYIREADVLWSKLIWRVIDLRQKINFPLYYPTMKMRDRQSLTQALYYAIMNKEIHAYDPVPGFQTPGDEFVQRYTPGEVRVSMGMDMDMVDTTMVTNPDGTKTMKVTEGDIPWQEVKQLWIKEEWFFDTKLSVLKVRVLGICPVRFYYDESAMMMDDLLDSPEMGGGMPQAEPKLKPTFWVYYPEARKVLSKTAFYNPKNDAQPSSYDDMFFKRRFGSYIIRESNEYDNRSINEYERGAIPIMREAERIYYDIFNTEIDMWEY